MTSHLLFTFMHWRRKWQPTPVFFPGESQGRGSLVGCRLWRHTESDTTDLTQQQQQQRLRLGRALGTRASVVAAGVSAVVVHELSLLYSMWNFPGTRIEPMFPALDGGFSSSVPLLPSPSSSTERLTEKISG